MHTHTTITHSRTIDDHTRTCTHTPPARHSARRAQPAVHRKRRQPGPYNFMEFCGGHTHAISRYGVADLLPPNVRMIHGPGCPVCVLPIGRIDLAIALALERGVILCTYGDTMRVPASDGLSLIKAKARGADIRMVYSAADALQAGRATPDREVVFFAIGFETTTPPTALVLREARREGLRQLQRAVLPRAHALRPSRTSWNRPRCAATARCRSTASSARRMSASSSAPSPTSTSPRSTASRW
jgi:hydrogenase expression/formation protein HypD